jgi:hypothetical protein
MVVMFLLSATASLGAVCSIYLAVLHVVDQEHRLRSDRLLRKEQGLLLGRAWRGCGAAAAAAWRRCCCCCCCRGGARGRRRRGRGCGAAGDGEARIADGAAAGGEAGGLQEEPPAGGEVAVLVDDSGTAGAELSAPLLQEAAWGQGDGAGEAAGGQPMQSWAGWVMSYATFGYLRGR